MMQETVSRDITNKAIQVIVTFLGMQLMEKGKKITWSMMKRITMAQ